MPVIKRRVLERLGEHLTALLDGLIPADDIVIGAQGSDKPACFPNLVVTSFGPWSFVPTEDDEVWSTDTTQTVCVGDLHGRVQIILGTSTQAKREEIEDKVLHDLYRQVNEQGFPRRGVLVLPIDGFTVDGTVNLEPFSVGYVLGNEEWEDEMAFEKKRYSNLTLEVDIPALATRAGVPTIDALVIALTEDLESEDPETDPPIAVDEDGDVSLYIDPP